MSSGRIPVPRFGHGSRVPGWDEAVDLTKDPAVVPDPATNPVPDELRAEIEAAGALDRSVYAEHLGTQRARVLPLSDVDGTVAAPYLSTVVILPPRGGRGEQL